MAKKPKAVDEATAETPDGRASVILREGPFDGAHDALPADTVVQGNELLIPAPVHKVCAIYQVTEPEDGIPTYRLARTEPIY